MRISKLTGSMLTIAFTLTGTVFAQEMVSLQMGEGQPLGGQRYSHSDRTAAAAALTPPQEVESDAWGRVLYFTHRYPHGLMSELQCHVFGLDAESEYQLWIDGVPVGEIMTDEGGEGWLRLQGRETEDLEDFERQYPPIPNDLPGPTGVEGASVSSKGDEAIALEGAFTQRTIPDVETGWPNFGGVFGITS